MELCILSKIHETIIYSTLFGPCLVPWGSACLGPISLPPPPQISNPTKTYKGKSETHTIGPTFANELPIDIHTKCAEYYLDHIVTRRLCGVDCSRWFEILLHVRPPCHQPHESSRCGSFRIAIFRLATTLLASLVNNF